MVTYFTLEMFHNNNCAACLLEKAEGAEGAEGLSFNSEMLFIYAGTGCVIMHSLCHGVAGLREAG